VCVPAAGALNVAHAVGHTQQLGLVQQAALLGGAHCPTARARLPALFALLQAHPMLWCMT
jgi:hypothetical protein